MGNAAILDENLALVATLTGGDWVRSLDNLLEPTVKETTARCVTGNPADAWFDVVWPAGDEKWDTLVIAGGAIHRAAQYRLTWYSDPSSRTPADILLGGPGAAFVPVYPPADRRSARRWYAKNFWRGGPTVRDLAGKTPQLLARPTRSPRCAAVRVEIDNQGAPLDLGLLFIARAFRPDWPHDWGLALESVSASPVDTTPGGRRLVDTRPAPRRKTVRFEDLSEDEAMRLADMGLRLDKSGVVLMVEDITQTRHQWRRVWPATLEDGGVAVTQNQGDLWSAQLKMLEIIG